MSLTYVAAVNTKGNRNLNQASESVKYYSIIIGLELAATMPKLVDLLIGHETPVY
jgi:hypothetical protein